MTNEEAVNRLTYDWYQALGGQVCVDADKSDKFLEAVGIGIKAINGQKKQPAHIDREAWEPCESCLSCDNCRNQKDYDPYEGTYGECGQCYGYAHFEPCNFCHECGKPLTPEAWEILEKRLRG